MGFTGFRVVSWWFHWFHVGFTGFRVVPWREKSSTDSDCWQTLHGGWPEESEAGWVLVVSLVSRGFYWFQAGFMLVSLVSRGFYWFQGGCMAGEVFH